MKRKTGSGSNRTARPRLRVLLGESIAIGPGKAALLEAIARNGSITAAARANGMSYRCAWNLVDSMNKCFVGPLVASSAGGQHGGGASLTDLLKPEELPYYIPAVRAAEVTPHAHTLVVTGTTLINDSLDTLLDLARPGTEIALIGPSVPLLPSAFLKRDIKVLGGVRVSNTDALLDCLAEGDSGYHFFSKSATRVTLRAEARQPGRLPGSSFCPRFH